jgi:hypothetical protein
MADEPDNLVLVTLREIRAKLDEYSAQFVKMHAHFEEMRKNFARVEGRLPRIEKRLAEVLMLSEMKWMRSKRRETLICLLICAVFAVISTDSKSQVSGPQSQSIAVKADIKSLCELVVKMQVIALRYYYDPATAEPRLLHPYAVGYNTKSRNRNILLFGQQIKGYSLSIESGTGELPGWRNFRVDKINTINALNSTFKADVYPDPKEYEFITQFACKNDSAFDR